MIGGFLFDSSVQSGFKLLIGRELVSPRIAAVFSALLSPLRLLTDVLNPSAFIAAVPIAGNSTPPAPSLPVTAIWLLSLGLWSLVALALFWLTKRGFQKYADTV
jgi:hypothetical protein